MQSAKFDLFCPTPAVADQQVNFDYAMKDFRDTATPDISSMNVVGDTDFFVIPPRYFSHLSDVQPKTFFLFEGVSAGKGQLKLVILKKENGAYVRVGQPLGRQPNVMGVFNGLQTSWNKYGDKHPGHSAEFRASIADRADYWKALLKSYDLQP